MNVDYDLWASLGRSNGQYQRFRQNMQSIVIRGLGLLAGLGLGVLFQQPVAAADRISVALNWVPAGDHAAMYYAKKLGWYSKANLDVDLEPGKGSVGVLQGVSAGLSQLGLADMGVAIGARGKGAKVVAVMNIYANTALGMYWLKSSGIRDIRDFAGKKIGVPPGDAQRALWPALAARNGVDPGTVTWVNIDPNGKLPALMAHAIDVTTNFYNLHHIMSRELGDDMGYLSWAKAGINPYGLTIFVNEEFLKTNEDVVSRFVVVTQRAYQACVASPEPCVSALTESVSGLKSDNERVNWKLTMQLMSDEISRSKALGYMDPVRMQADYDLVAKYLGVASPFDVNTMFTNRFLDLSIKMVEVSN
jgi:NitT/TauT family transport system substrate-binding protein